MAVTEKLLPVDGLEYFSTGQILVDNYNSAAEMLNFLILNQSTGVIGTAGTVGFIADSVETTLTSNFNKGLAVGAVTTELQLRDWKLFFGSKVVTITSLSTAISLDTDKGYVYVDSAGEPVTVTDPFSSYQPDKIRILRFEKNSIGEVSIIIMPELAGTPKYLRSISITQPLLQVTELAINATGVTLSRTNTKCLTEGAGCMSNSDENVLVFDDETTVPIVNEDSNVEYTDLVTTGSAGTFLTKQLSLAYDGKLIVQDGTNTYFSLEEASIELPYEYFPPANGDVVGEYTPVLRIAYEANTADLGDDTKAYLLNLTEKTELVRTPVWYTK